ncbi:MAG: Tad domain-containing protein [Desulfuromonadales bacterium]|nr:Tad domain-containing protein [Desulfuromonadales bacterium]
MCAKKTHKKDRGAILVLVAFFLIVLIAAIAFAVDINHLYVVRNELQNAADAGALAGAGALYTEFTDADGNLVKAGTAVNPGANQIAFDTAKWNMSDNESVDINWPTGNIVTDDIQRGHWSFSEDKFYESNSTVAVPLWGVSDEDLDKMDGVNFTDPDGNKPVFINAVRVVTRRSETPAISLFAEFFGIEGFDMQMEAVAYIGFAGSLGPLEAEQPIVICDETLTNNNGEYECNVGRMLDSGSSCSPSDPSCDPSINTAGWSDMTVSEEVNQCSGSSSASDVKALVCKGGANPTEIKGGDYLSATNGVQTSSYNDMKSCWSAATSGGTEPYQMMLPVVDCGSGTSVDNCVRVVGAVTVNMLFMSKNGGTKPEDAPTTMADPVPDDDKFENFNNWSYDDNCGAFNDLIGAPTLPPAAGNALDSLNELFPGPGVYDRWLAYPDNPSDQRWKGESITYTLGMARWDCFVNHFGLINTNGKMAPLANESMYFMPDCSPHLPSGETAGSNFGVLAKYPVLVE